MAAVAPTSFCCSCSSCLAACAIEFMLLTTKITICKKRQKKEIKRDSAPQIWLPAPHTTDHKDCDLQEEAKERNQKGLGSSIWLPAPHTTNHKYRDLQEEAKKEIKRDSAPQIWLPAPHTADHKDRDLQEEAKERNQKGLSSSNLAARTTHR